MQANIKTKNSKKLKVNILVDFRCTYTGIDEQLVKNKKIQRVRVRVRVATKSAQRLGRYPQPPFCLI